MAKTKIPENESPREKEIRQIFEYVANAANRSEKTSWNRKLDNMLKLLVTLQPIEDKILEIIKTEKIPLTDQITALRKTMVNECVHPFEYLTITDDNIVTCKFCNKRVNYTHGQKDNNI